MQTEEFYRGREQTYIKHLILKQYLQKLAYKWGWNGGVLSYVDCFAGPWRHESEDLADTSPFIAIDELRRARDTLLERGRPRLKVCCFFIERDREASELLTEKVRDVSDISVDVVNGSFEDNVGSILEFVSGSGRRFSFFFIDPTGWTGYPIGVIGPLLRHRPGEVLINFMTQHISRFIDSGRAEDALHFDRLFGTAGYRDRWRGLEGLDREDEIVRIYGERVRREGGFEFVASTTILHPVSDRTYFHLIYGTRHIEGLRVFRNDAERPADEVQQRVRQESQARARMEKTSQMELFGPGETEARSHLDDLRDRYHPEGRSRVVELLEEKRKVPFDDLEAAALLVSHVSTRDLKRWLTEWKERGIVAFEGLKPRGRIPQAGKGHDVVLVRSFRTGE